MTATDQMRRTILLKNAPPQRIISLVPSQTELLHDLGLGDRVVGITKFCTRPAHWYPEKAHVGGTKTILFEKIAALAPDLILGNKEENDRDQVAQLAARWPVWMSDIQTLDDALAMIESVGKLTATEARAVGISQNIREKFSFLPKNGGKIRAAYLIWRKPHMVAASGTFIDEMLRRAGFENVFGEKTRYPEVFLDEIAAQKPDAILLSSEPFPFREKHFAEFRAACPNSTILIVDGELFSWYGTRLLHAPDYFLGLRGDIQKHLQNDQTDF